MNTIQDELIKDGTMWDYATAEPQQVWAARPIKERITDTHPRFLNYTKTNGLGQIIRIDYQQKTTIFSNGLTMHPAFIDTHGDQILTCILPPVWAWMTSEKLAGVWC